MIIIHKLAQCPPRLMGLVALVLSAGVIAVAACAPAPQLLRLADGTEVFYLSNTSVKPAADYPRPREIKIDGEAFIRAAAAVQPLIIRSRLLVLTVSGSSALRVTARSSETGEEADVLYGRVEARKAYPSPQSEPDILLAGEEVMVNETIDLQEKETADVPGLRSWSDALMASVARKNGR
jgi:ferric-dicitrate binding protein FerR (iron transport regulator)